MGLCKQNGRQCLQPGCAKLFWLWDEVTPPGPSSDPSALALPGLRVRQVPETKTSRHSLPSSPHWQSGAGRVAQRQLLMSEDRRDAFGACGRGSSWDLWGHSLCHGGIFPSWGQWCPCTPVNGGGWKCGWLTVSMQDTLGQQSQLCWGQQSPCSFWLHRLAAAEG